MSRGTSGDLEDIGVDVAISSDSPKLKIFSEKVV